MKKRKSRLICILTAALVLAGYFWYTRPMTLDRLCPDLPLDQITGVSGWYRFPGSEIQNFTLEEEQVDALLTLVKRQTFRRSPANLLPRGGVRFASGGDFTWLVNFEFRGEPLRDAAGNGSDNFAKKDWEVHSPAFSQWRQDVFSIITDGRS